MRRAKIVAVLGLASGFLALANMECSLDGLADGDASDAPTASDASDASALSPDVAVQGADAAPTDAAKSVDALTPDAFDGCPDLDLGSVSLAEQNHPAGPSKYSDGGYRCFVDAGILYCANGISDTYKDSGDDNIYAYAQRDAAIINRFVHDFSFFECWATGEFHVTNTTWYRTIGGRSTSWGWAPAWEIYTGTNGFDDNPSAYGLPKCPVECKPLHASREIDGAP